MFWKLENSFKLGIAVGMWNPVWSSSPRAWNVDPAGQLFGWAPGAGRNRDCISHRRHLKLSPFLGPLPGDLVLRLGKLVVLRLPGAYLRPLNQGGVFQGSTPPPPAGLFVCFCLSWEGNTNSLGWPWIQLWVTLNRPFCLQHPSAGIVGLCLFVCLLFLSTQILSGNLSHYKVKRKYSFASVLLLKVLQKTH